MRQPLVSTTIDGNVRLAVPHTHAAGHDPQGGYVPQVFGCTTRDATTLEMSVADWRRVVAQLTAKLDDVERRAWASQAADPPAVVEFGGEAGAG